MKRSLILLFLISFCLFPGVSSGEEKNPGVVTLDSISDMYEAVRFDHETHTAIAGNCGACHHEHGNSGSLPCKECHNVSPDIFKKSVINNFTACKNCHVDADPENPAIPSLKVAYHKACFQCHRGMSDVGIDPKGCAEMCHAKKEQRAGLEIEQ